MRAGHETRLVCQGHAANSLDPCSRSGPASGRGHGKNWGQAHDTGHKDDIPRTQLGFPALHLGARVRLGVRLGLGEGEFDPNFNPDPNPDLNPSPSPTLSLTLTLFDQTLHWTRLSRMRAGHETRLVSRGLTCAPPCVPPNPALCA